jgi:hypothetical protein
MGNKYSYFLLIFVLYLIFLTGLFGNYTSTTSNLDYDINLELIPASHPVIEVDYAMPTADKPQSKLWYMHNSWWAILPRSTGPSLWQRTETGWEEYHYVTNGLQGIPGRVDVWADDMEITAVGVADVAKTNRSMTVFRLKMDTTKSKVAWESKILSELFPPSVNDLIETATIVKDGIGNFWVSAVAGTVVCVWGSSDNGENWSDPIILAKGINEDDISVITNLPGGVGVIWSDQVRDAVLIRTHTDGDPVKTWQVEQVIESGNDTADDHLNTSLSPDGTLWVATKNEVDLTGKPQFVLRIRSTDGKWSNRPYVIKESTTHSPSRPIVVATEDASMVFTGYGDNDRSLPFPYDAKIVFARVDTTLSMVLDNSQVVIFPDNVYNSFIQNVTGPRNPFPMNAPWIILASDTEGRVYEADLRKLFYKKQ